jgi:hypothetical protein
MNIGKQKRDKARCEFGPALALQTLSQQRDECRRVFKNRLNSSGRIVNTLVDAPRPS